MFNSLVESCYLLTAKLQEVESKVEGYDRLLDVAREKEQKLKGKLDTLKKSSETVAWELKN